MFYKFDIDSKSTGWYGHQVVAKIAQSLCDSMIKALVSYRMGEGVPAILG